MLKSPNLQHYYNSEPTAGIIRIYNLQSEKSLLIKSSNIIEDTKNIRFQLDLGFYTNKNLQKEYSDLGLEIFAIDPFVYKKETENLDDLLINAKKTLVNKQIELY